MRPALLVVEMERDWDRGVAGRLHQAFLRRALIGEEIGLAHVEIEVDGIERNDGGEQSRVAAVAAAHEMIADAPGDRRRDAGELDIEFP